MEYAGVLAAAVAAYAFGAVWYMLLASQWMAAAGVSREQVDRGNPTPYIISFVAVVLVAGMMRHVFAQAGIDSPGRGLVSGFGLGAFVAAPWTITNYAYAGRPVSLMLIDGVYAVSGCAIIGLVLTLF